MSDQVTRSLMAPATHIATSLCSPWPTDFDLQTPLIAPNFNTSVDTFDDLTLPEWRNEVIFGSMDTVQNLTDSLIYTSEPTFAYAVGCYFSD
jgi:hypothetical protein